MKKIIRIKNKIQGIKYFLTAICVLILALIAKVKKENNLNTQQTVPITSEFYDDKKKFTSVEVMHGDTLWSIAAENKTGDYTTKALVEEIKHTNGLKGDKIITGNYLIVPYYD